MNSNNPETDRKKPSPEQLATMQEVLKYASYRRDTYDRVVRLFTSMTRSVSGVALRDILSQERNMLGCINRLREIGVVTSDTRGSYVYINNTPAADELTIFLRMHQTVTHDQIISVFMKHYKITKEAQSIEEFVETTLLNRKATTLQDIVTTLGKGTSLTRKELTQSIGVSLGVIGKAINKLLELQLIELDTEHVDRYRKPYMLTEKGMKVHTVLSPKEVEDPQYTE